MLSNQDYHAKDTNEHKNGRCSPNQINAKRIYVKYAQLVYAKRFEYIEVASMSFCAMRPIVANGGSQRQFLAHFWYAFQLNTNIDIHFKSVDSNC